MGFILGQDRPRQPALFSLGDDLSRDWFHLPFRAQPLKTELVLLASRCFQIRLPANGCFHFIFAGNFGISKQALFAVLAAIACFLSRQTVG